MPSILSRRGDFWANLDRFEDAPALVDGDRTVSYVGLAGMAEAAGRELGPERRLVLLEGANTIDFVAWYLAALASRHPVLVASDAGHRDRLTRVFDPDTIVVGGDVVHRHKMPAHMLHPELAALVSTSGSTGSPKVVRLSRENLAANTASITEYLGLRGTDRILTSLPLHYCYGASLLHTHLAVGATVVLTDLSVTDPCFWELFDRMGATGLAGVPYSFSLLDRIGFTGADHPSLRYVTQAGGRLDAASVRRYAELGRSLGWELFVMYGQTEATARMAYLPPDLAIDRPSAVGVAVPGGRFTIEPDPESGDPGVGEVVYHGPNVMLGYAHEPADLALGRTIDGLRTGDLGRLDDGGILEIVGRRSRFAKLFGLRIDLDLLEANLRKDGVEASAASDDTILAVGIRGVGDHAARIAVDSGLPLHAVEVVLYDHDLPRHRTGKPDTTQILQDAIDQRATIDAPLADGATVGAVFQHVLGLPAPPEEADSFVSLGGDSLSYIEASILLEERLGSLPAGWHLRPIGELGSEPPRTRRLRSVETSVVLRALSIVLIVGNHTRQWMIPGGAHVLLAVAGFNLGRFGTKRSSMWRSILRIAVPSVVWISIAAALSDKWDHTNALLVRQWFGGSDPAWGYWFIETLLAILVPAAILFSSPRIRALDARQPLLLPGVTVLVGLAIRWDIWDTVDQQLRLYRPQEVLWLVALGWCASRASTARHRWVVTAVAVAGSWDFFNSPRTNVIMCAGVLALCWVPTIPLPRPATRTIGALASASLYIYLTHWQAFPPLRQYGTLAATVGALTAGTFAWKLTSWLLARVSRIRRRAGRRGATLLSA